MNDEVTRKRLDEASDESKEDGLGQMLKDFYNRRMAGVVIMVWASAVAFMALAVWCAVEFFRAAETRDQIMYAVGFLMFVQWVGLMKVFAWQMIHRNAIKRQIKRLEQRIAQLAAGQKP